jgi:RecB family exonuclease
LGALYSHSRLSSFENCRKQFEFRYIQKIPSETESIEAFVGKRVHEILERLYLFVGRGQIPGVEKVVDRYQKLWEETYDAERVRIIREGTPLAFYRNLGESCLRGYYLRHYPFDDSETLGIEKRVVFPLDDAGEYKMQGIIDRISRARDGVIEVHDYKTGARVPSQKMLDQDRQLALYQIGLTRQFGEDQPFRLVWHYVAKNQTRVSTRTPEELTKLRETTIARYCGMNNITRCGNVVPSTQIAPFSATTNSPRAITQSRDASECGSSIVEASTFPGVISGTSEAICFASA